jgi:hypothetical protein
LIAPLGVGDEHVVVVDQLAAHAQAGSLLSWVAKLHIRFLQIPAVHVRRADRWLLEEGPRVLHLR